jgi:hypothetical protein
LPRRLRIDPLRCAHPHEAKNPALMIFSRLGNNPASGNQES